MRLDTADTFFLRMISICFISALAVAVLTFERNPSFGKPVNLYLAAPTAKSCGEDWLCLLQREHIIRNAKGVVQ